MTTPTVTLTFHMSAELLGQLTQNGNNNGVNAYLWYNDPATSGTNANWTNIVLNGTAQTTANGGTGTADPNHPGYTDWTVTLANGADVKGGKVYLLIQSNPTSDPTANNLITDIGSTEGNITPANGAAWNFGYDTFEVALGNGTADVADLSAINSFSHQLGISATYSDATTAARGYSSTVPDLSKPAPQPTVADTAAQWDANIDTIGQKQPSGLAAVVPYPTGSTLAGQGMIAITPATDNGQQAPSGYTTVWQASDWQAYVTEAGSLSDIKLVGYFNGAEDAAGVWHNAGYYAFSVKQESLAAGAYGAAGNYFVLSPDAASQIKGYIVISPQNLMNNLYSPGLASSPAYVFSDAALQSPYNIDGTSPTGLMNTGANNQWGTVFTQLFTGFSGGYSAVSASPSRRRSNSLRPTRPPSPSTSTRTTIGIRPMPSTGRAATPFRPPSTTIPTRSSTSPIPASTARPTATR